MFKERAQHVADKLLPAFQTPTGIPNALVNVRTGYSKNYGWASGGSSILSELGTLHLEFVYLSDVTGNPVYKERVLNIQQILKEIEKPKGLYPNYLNPKTGKWGQRKYFFNPFYVSPSYILTILFSTSQNTCHWVHLATVFTNIY